ncbi:MAG: GNAT family N-acyltransferase [Casimicrobiaceae bacterium]
MKAEIIAGIPSKLLKAEVDALPAEQRLFDNGRFRVCYARAAQMPWCLRELGRLRELTFRTAGEGTGKPSDIDRFDAYYLHLFVWDTQAEVIAGAYRLGLADQIVDRYGTRGLYTQSLFKYGDALLRSLNPAIELGRSFVRSEYQRDGSTLSLLWLGIGRFIVLAPRYAMLFGAVSISASYDSDSRRLMVAFLTAKRIDANRARHVKPRRPPLEHIGAMHLDGDLTDLKSVEDLSRLISRIEPDRRGIPILLRQYLKCGGQLLGFSSDKRFGNTIDGLIVVDLRNTPRRTLARYMSESGASAFLGHHAALPSLPSCDFYDRCSANRISY